MLSRFYPQKIIFSFQAKRFAIPKVAGIKTVINTIISDEKINFESLSYIFCTDEYLLTLNRQFLQHEDYTDIITFNLANDDLPIIGECYISIDRVKDNANLYNTTFINELVRVIFHGVLHLCGYLDKLQPDILLMREKENYYLLLFKAS